MACAKGPKSMGSEQKKMVRCFSTPHVQNAPINAKGFVSSSQL